MLKILIYIRTIFSIWYLFLKGLHTYSLDILELSLCVKMDNGIFGVIQQTQNTKWARILYQN